MQLQCNCDYFYNDSQFLHTYQKNEKGRQSDGPVLGGQIGQMNCPQEAVRNLKIKEINKIKMNNKPGPRGDMR